MAAFGQQETEDCLQGESPRVSGETFQPLRLYHLNSMLLPHGHYCWAGFPFRIQSVTVEYTVRIMATPRMSLHMLIKTEPFLKG